MWKIMESENKVALNRLKVESINLITLKNKILEFIKNESIRNCDELNYFRLFLHQIYVYLLNCQSIFLEPRNNTVLQHLKEIDDINDELDYVRRTINQMLNRYYLSQVHAVIEQTFKDYIDTHQIDVKLPFRHDKNSCDFDGCCFSDKRAKPKNIIFFSSKVMKHNQMENLQKKQINSFFEALTILRNRAGHSNNILSNEEIRKLQNYPEICAINNDNIIEVNFIHLAYLSQKVKDCLFAIFIDSPDNSKNIIQHTK